MEDPFAAKIPLFAEDYQKLKSELLWKHETIHFVGNCSFIARFGYIVITSERVICVCFGSTTPGLFSHFGGRARVKIKVDVHIAEIRYTPNPPLTKDELNTRRVFEVPLVNITWLDKQKEYEVSIENQKLRVLPIRLKGIAIGGELWPPVFPELFFFFDSEDGKRAYELLGIASTRGRIPISHSSAEKKDVPELLQALAKLHDNGVITEQEFENKKKDLLSRM